MLNEFSRSELLLGTEGIKKLKKSKVIVFGVGGVGSYCVEALARTGVGYLALVDNDTVSLTNINRQLIALHSTVGKLKVEVAKERILDINPECNVEVFPCFYTEDNSGGINIKKYDYIVDAIDTVKSKVKIICEAQKAGVPIISSMGAGNKLDATKFKIADIYKTEMCPLAKVMRRELRLKGIKKHKVLFSTAEATEVIGICEEKLPVKSFIPGSIAYVPSVAGLLIAGEVIKELTSE